MRTINILCISVALSALAGCQRIDAESMVRRDIDLRRCLQPIDVKAKVDADVVTISLSPFPDAEKYVFEIYLEDELRKRDTVQRAEIPYVFKVPAADVGEEMTFKVAAINETAGKEMSTWASGKFKTKEDTSHICAKPDCTVSVLNRKVTFSWTKPETDKYRFELYDKDGKEICAKDLTNEQVPFSLMLDAVTSYKYKVKAMDIAGERSDSRWVEKSFETGEEYVWLNSDIVLENGLDVDFSSDEFKLFPMNEDIASTTTIHNITVWEKCRWTGTAINTRGSIESANLDSQYGITIPKDVKKFVSFYVCKPGTLTLSMKQGSSSKPAVTVSVLTTTPAGKTAGYLLNDSSFSSKKTVDIALTEDILYGISEPARIYIYSSDNGYVYLYNVKWVEGDK